MPRTPFSYMCWKCQEAEKAIARYRDMQSRVTDELSQAGLNLLIKTAEAKRERFRREEVATHARQRDHDPASSVPTRSAFAMMLKVSPFGGSHGKIEPSAR